jgi:2-oxoglutarate/2-oxoacid ferredoxin oxidoreductase subunit alpha
MDNAEIGIIAWGSTEPAINEARQRLLDHGVKTDFMRIRAIPFNQEVGEFIKNHKRTYVVELNRDGQMYQLLDLNFAKHCAKLISLSHLDGLPLTARWVDESIRAKEDEQ